MWCKIERKYPKEAKLAWPKAKTAKTCYCSKQGVNHILRKIEKLGAIKMLQACKLGATLCVGVHD